MDAQSPARLEPMIAQDHSTWAGAFRPQDTLTTHVGAAMVQSIADLRISQVTGAPLAAAFVTGDTADMLSHLETRWYVDLLDGTPLVPNSGAVGVYEGVQVWDEAYWAYHPENPEGDWFGNYGFPRIPGLLDGGGDADRRQRGTAGALVRDLRQPRHHAARHARGARWRYKEFAVGRPQVLGLAGARARLRAGLGGGHVGPHARDPRR